MKFLNNNSWKLLFLVFIICFLIENSHGLKRLSSQLSGRTAGSSPDQFTIFKAQAFFSADDGFYGQELWRTNGVNVTRISDIGPASEASFPFVLTNFHDEYLIFSASSSATGREPYITNGTQVELLKDINPGELSSNPGGFFVLNSSVLFVADDGVNGVELWVTNMTTNGTLLLIDLTPGNESSNILSAVVINGTDLFFILQGTTTATLWRSNGTLEGTFPIYNLPSNIGIGFAIEFKNQYWFTLYQDSTGFEPWISDGTPQGTRLFADLFPGPDSSDPRNYMIVNDTLLFFTATNVNGTELWRSDLTLEGTFMVEDLTPGPNSSNINGLIAFEDQLLFFFNNTLYITNGSRNDVIPLGNLSLSFPIGIINNEFIFLGTSNSNFTNQELYSTNGTREGTGLFLEIVAGDSGTFVSSSIVLGNNSLLFSAYNVTTGSELWITNGSTNGTFLLKDINQIDLADAFILGFLPEIGGLVYTINEESIGRELWMIPGNFTNQTSQVDDQSNSNNSTNSTINILLKDIYPGSGDGVLSSFGNTQVINNNTVFFLATTNGTDQGLWITNGTTNGTILVKPLLSGGAFFLGTTSDLLYFLIGTGRFSAVLWRSDGTSIGTFALSNVTTFYFSSVILDEYLYYVDIGINGTELFRSNGSIEGTSEFIDIVPGENSSIPQNLISVPNLGLVFFSAMTPETGRELWMANKTSARLVIDIVPGSNSSNPEFFTATSSRLFFWINIESISQLWWTNGTTTQFVRNFTGSIGSSGIGVGDLAFFYLSQNETGNELWVSSGTENGTFLVSDINPGPSSSRTFSLTSSEAIMVRNFLIFAADNGTNGKELWISTGNSTGNSTSSSSETQMLSDIMPGPLSSFPSQLIFIDNPLFNQGRPSIVFTAINGTNGRQIFLLP